MSRIRWVPNSRYRRHAFRTAAFVASSGHAPSWVVSPRLAAALGRAWLIGLGLCAAAPAQAGIAAWGSNFNGQCNVPALPGLAYQPVAEPRRPERQCRRNRISVPVRLIVAGR